ncbi:ABC transporter permease [Caulobacter sp. S45]|uniref:ABC transporter permease n=1 Tax=Caulobacter sp. S45 TaxID=1641861 RepID=UPI001576FBFE|nr:ABC transporter permease [Caulobacter sp. S45]
MERLRGMGASVLLAAALLVGWQAACLAFTVPSYVLPTPLQTAEALGQDWAELAAAAWSTLSMSLLALVLATAVALPLALVTGLSRWAERAVKPLAVTLQVTPVVAIAPLVTIWAGLDHAGRAIVALAAVVAFFPLYSGAATGLRSADPDLERLFDLYGATRVQRLLRLQLPAAAPYLLEGFKVAVGLAIIGAVVAEFVAGSGQAQGLAWRILEAEHQLRTPEMFAALAVLAALGAGLHALADLAERRLLRLWRGRD